MIVTCDNCQTRYNLPLSEIRESGRRVRCTNCGHEWTQFRNPDEKRGEEEESDFIEVVMPDREMVIEAAVGGDDLEPIPDAVKPNHDSDDIRKMISPPMRMPGLSPAARGYAAAACLFVLRQVQEEFHDPRPVPMQVTLEIGD